MFVYKSSFAVAWDTHVLRKIQVSNAFQMTGKQHAFFLSYYHHFTFQVLQVGFKVTYNSESGLLRICIKNVDIQIIMAQHIRVTLLCTLLR